MTQPPPTTGAATTRVFPCLERAAERDTLGTMKYKEEPPFDELMVTDASLLGDTEDEVQERTRELR